MNYKLLVLLFSFSNLFAQKVQVKKAVKGDIFILQLHSGNFYPRAEDVEWSASVVDRPGLPSWLRLAFSPYKAIAYLFGTPDTDEKSYRIEVFARSLQGYFISRKEFQIEVEQNDNYNAEPKQIAEFILTNKDSWELLSDSRLSDQLQSAVRKTFPGTEVFPYIENLQPADGSVRPKDTRTSSKKIGTLVSVGTKNGFHDGVLNLAKGLQTNPAQCTRNDLIPLDKPFRPQFQINWCTFKIQNNGLDIARKADDPVIVNPILSKKNGLDSRVDLSKISVDNVSLAQLGSFETSKPGDGSREYFWIWILVLPIPAVILILLTLLLSYIFFGHREGQRWRDYKTPKEQLQQYLNLRKGQQRLRELNTQRQSLICVEQKPTGIQAFLTPKNGSEMPLAARPPPANYAPLSNYDLGPVGKQTVAEAAAVHGADVALYVEPGGDDDDEEDTPKMHESKDSSETDTITTPEELAQRKREDKSQTLDYSTSV